MKCSGAVFDLDGVITGTAEIHFRAWKRTFEDFLARRGNGSRDSARPFTYTDDYVPFVDGKPRYDGVRAFLESRNISLPWGEPSDPPGTETVCGVGNRKNEIFQELILEEPVPVYDSTVDFVKGLKRRGISVSVASSSANCKQILQSSGLDALFEAVVDGTMSRELGLAGKPAPDIFLKAAEMMGRAPAECVMVEDAYAGVAAGRNGNFGLVLGVARKGDRWGLRERGADIVVTDMSEFSLADLDDWFGSGLERDGWELWIPHPTPPAWARIELRISDEEFIRPREQEVLEHWGVLDMRRSVRNRTMTFRDGAGRITTVRTRRPALPAMQNAEPPREDRSWLIEYAITPQNYSAGIEVRSEGGNREYAGGKSWRILNDGRDVAADGSSDPTETSPVHVSEGNTLTLERIGGVESFSSALADHSRWWEELWSRGGVAIEGDRLSQKGARFELYRLLLTIEKLRERAHPDSRVAAANRERAAIIGSRSARSFCNFHFPEMGRYALVDLCVAEATASPAECTSDLRQLAENASSIWDYYLCTSDDEFMNEFGAAALVSLCRRIAALAERGAGDRFTLRGGNAALHVIVAWVLHRTIQLFGQLSPAARGRIEADADFSAKELHYWADLAHNFAVPVDRNGVVVEPASTDPEFLLCFSVLNAQQVVDVLGMMGYEVGDPITFLRANIARDEAERSNGEGGTSANGERGWVEAVRRSVAESQLDGEWEPLDRDLRDYFRSRLDEMQELGGRIESDSSDAAATADLLLRVITGFRGYADRMEFHPHIPGTWRLLEAPMEFRGTRLRVEIAPGKVPTVAAEIDGTLHALSPQFDNRRSTFRYSIPPG